jgi:hypothetical protein
MEPKLNARQRKQVLAKVIAKAWADPDYKKRLMKNPKAVLAEAGIELRPGYRVVIQEGEPNTWHFILPAKPEGLVGEKPSVAAEAMAPCCALAPDEIA